jgi:hypothetical protein
VSPAVTLAGGCPESRGPGTGGGRRRSHLPLGYGTLFDFATRHLRYAASGRSRIQVTLRDTNGFLEQSRPRNRNDTPSQVSHSRSGSNSC